MNKMTRREILQAGTDVMLTGLLIGGLEANSRGAVRAAGRAVKCVALSSDGVLLAAPIAGKGIGLFDYASAMRLRTLELPAEIEVLALAFAGKGSRLAVLQLDANAAILAAGCSDGAVRLWDAQTGKTLGTILAHKAGVTAICLTPDGKTLVTAADSEPTLRVWDVTSRNLSGEFAGHANGIAGIALSPDGKTLAAGGRGFDPTIHLYDMARGGQSKMFTAYLKGEHKLSISALAFSSDGKRLASGSLDKTARVWNIAERKATAKFDEHEASILSIAFHPNGRNVVSGSPDKTVRQWDADTGKLIQMLGSFKGEVYAIAFAPNGQSLAVVGQDGLMRVSVPEK